MKAKNSRLTPTAVGILVALAVFSVSCDEVDQPVAPDFAAGGRGLTVTSVVPDTAERGITLDVTVNGSGFDQGSVVGFERQGAPATAITTNSTTFVTTKKLTANITIAADADTGKYDVAVTTSGGRKGVGIELFAVTFKLDELGIIGGTWSRAHAINDLGEVVGVSCTADCLATAFYWSDAGGLEDLGTLPGYSRSGAYAINSRGQVFGQVRCFISDPGCGGVYKEALVRWDRVGGDWTITPVQGCSVAQPISETSERFLINNNDQCVSRTAASTLLVQTLSGGSIVSQEPLPPVAPGGRDWANAISDAPMVAGSGGPVGQPDVPVVWYRDAAGAWAVLALGFPGTDNRGRATDISEPDAAGLVRVSGLTEDIGASQSQRATRAVRWTLRSDGLGGWEVASVEVLGSSKQGGSSDNGFARAVNQVGDVVGNAGGSYSTGTPVRWPVAGGIQTLPTARGSGEGRAMDINSQSWIVGAVFDRTNNCDRAAIWRPM